MLNRFKKHLTATNILATCALIIATSGTAYAAISITGKQVAPNALTGAHFKSESISSAKINADVRNSFKGPTGDKGAAGKKGAKGEPGLQGDPGATGLPAQVFTSYSSANFDSSPLAVNANTPIVNLTSPGSNGLVIANWSQTTLMAWASISLKYTGNNLHTRAVCYMEIDGVKAGPNVFVSANNSDEIKNVFLVGNLQRGAGTYNAQVKCSDADPTTNVTRWSALRANLVLSASEKK